MFSAPYLPCTPHPWGSFAKGTRSKVFGGYFPTFRAGCDIEGLPARICDARAVVDDMLKMPSPTPTKGRTKHGGPALTKREGLALAFRRWTIRQEAAEEKARARSEAKSEARHKCAVARRENTNGLAVQRVKACQRYLSPHAVEQLAAIAKNSALGPAVRTEAANELLRIGFGPPSTAF